MNIAFYKYFSMSSMCSTGFPFIHMVSIAIYLLNVMFSPSNDAQNRNGCIECLIHISHDSYIIQIHYLCSGVKSVDMLP